MEWLKVQAPSSSPSTTQRKKILLRKEVHAYNLSTPKTEAVGSQVQDQPGLPREILSLKKSKGSTKITVS
jgi:hypothetical protein